LLAVGIQSRHVLVEQETTQGLREPNVRIVPFHTLSYYQWWSYNQGQFCWSPELCTCVWFKAFASL